MNTKIEELKNWIQTTPIGGIVDYADLYNEFVGKRRWTSGSLSGHLNSLNEATPSGDRAYRGGGEVVTNFNMPRRSYKRIR